MEHANQAAGDPANAGATARAAADGADSRRRRCRDRARGLRIRDDQRLCDRHLRRLHELHEGLFTADLGRLPFAEMFDRIVDTLARYHDENPGFQPLFYGSATSPALAAAADRLHDECIDRVDGLMAIRLPGMNAARRRQLAEINVDTVRAILPRAAAAEPAVRESMLRELKRMMTVYAEDCWTRFGSPSGT